MADTLRHEVMLPVQNSQSFRPTRIFGSKPELVSPGSANPDQTNMHKADGASG